jgi:hypothetical protein
VSVPGKQKGLSSILYFRKHNFSQTIVYCLPLDPAALEHGWDLQAPSSQIALNSKKSDVLSQIL